MCVLNFDVPLKIDISSCVSGRIMALLMPKEWQMTTKALFGRYVKDLTAVAQQGDAREESYYSAFSALLEAVAGEIGRDHVPYVNLAKADLCRQSRFSPSSESK